MADVPLIAGKSVLVTGGTGGIGKATAIGLAGLGARVGITGRDQARTEAAAAGIRAAAGSPAVDAFAADMSVQAGVRRLAAQVLDTYPRLDVLVNNAGGFWAHRHVTADGLEHTFALNGQRRAGRHDSNRIVCPCFSACAAPRSSDRRVLTTVCLHIVSTPPRSQARAVRSDGSISVS